MAPTNASRGRRRGSNPNPKPKPNAHRRVRSTPEPKPSVSHSSPTIVRGSFTFTSTSASTTRSSVPRRPRRGFLVRRRRDSPRRRPPTHPSPRSDGTDHARTRPRSISLRSIILRSTRIVATESTVRIPRGFERERRRASTGARRGARGRRACSPPRATDEDGGRVWVLVDAATDASFTLAPPEGTAFDSNARVAFLSAPPSRRERESEISESRSTTPTTAATTGRNAVAAVDLGGGGSFLTRVASAAEIFFGSRDDLVATEKEAAAFYEATSRVESSRIESTAREDVVAAGLADGRVALFRVRDDGGAKNATLTAILDVSRGWRRLDDIAARAGSNPVPATTATLFTVADDSAATFASSSSSLESIASLVSGDDAGNLRVERVPLGAGFPSHVVPRAHVGEVTCISDAGGGTFLTGARRRRDDGLGRDARERNRVASRRFDITSRRFAPSSRSTCTATGAAAARAARGGGVYRRWRRRRRSRVHSATTPRRRRIGRVSRPSRARGARRAAAAPGRGALESVLWDPAAGALSCVFVRIPRIQRGTNPENPEEHDAAAERERRALPRGRRRHSTSSQRGGVGRDDGRPGSRGGGRGGVRVSPTRARDVPTMGD